MAGFPEYDVTVFRHGDRVLFELRNLAHEVVGTGGIPVSWLADVIDVAGSRFNVTLYDQPQARDSAQAGG